MKRTVIYIDRAGIANAEKVKRDTDYIEFPDGYHIASGGVYRHENAASRLPPLVFHWHDRGEPEGIPNDKEILSANLCQAEYSRQHHVKIITNRLSTRRFVEGIYIFARMILFGWFAFVMGLGLYIASMLISPLLAAALVGVVVAGYWYRLRGEAEITEHIDIDLKPDWTYSVARGEGVAKNAFKLKGYHPWREFHPLLPWSIISEVYHDKFKPFIMTIKRDGVEILAPFPFQPHGFTTGFVKTWIRSILYTKYRKKASFANGSNSFFLLLIIGFLVILVLLFTVKII